MYAGTGAEFSCPSYEKWKRLQRKLDYSGNASDNQTEEAFENMQKRYDTFDTPYYDERRLRPVLKRKGTLGFNLEMDCALDYEGFARTIFLAGNKAARAGGSCSGLKTACAQNLMLAAAALSNLAEEATLLHKFCLPTKRCCKFNFGQKRVVCACSEADLQEVNAYNLRHQSACAKYSQGVAKSVGAGATFITESLESCRNSDKNSAKTGCASMIPFALGSWAFFGEWSSELGLKCPKTMYQALYSCGVQFQLMGNALDQAAQTTAAAVINCRGAEHGWVEYTSNIRAIGAIGAHRRFFIP